MENKIFALNRKAQEFEVFRFLIAAIMGLAILTIILTIIGNLDELKKQANTTDFYAKMDSAVEGAGLGEYLVSKGVFFTKGDVLSEIAIKNRYTNVESIFFNGNSSCFLDEGNKITTIKDCKVDVYIWCNTMYGNSDKLECYLNLGVKPLETNGGK